MKTVKKADKVKLSSKSTPKKRTSSKKIKKVSLLTRFQNLSKRGQLIVFGLVFAVLGGGFMLYQSFASDGIPDQANQLVMSYDIGMPHSYPEDNFPNAMPSAMLLYGNGLMLCNTDSLMAAGGMSENMSMVNSVNTWNQRNLTHDEVRTFVTKVKEGGFTHALAIPVKAGEPAPSAAFSNSILLNSTTGSDVVYASHGGPQSGFASAESIVKAECAKATTPYQPDDVLSDTITLPADSPDSAQATTPLPAEVDADTTPKQGKQKHFTGTEAKALKTRMSMEPKVYKKDGQAVRARLVSLVPSYVEPKPRVASSKGKVSAASTFHTRWLIVLGAGQSVPAWVTSTTLNADVNSIRSYYNNQLGKTFDPPDQISIVRSSKTPSQLRTCPAGYDCGSTSTPRLHAFYSTFSNLQIEFHKPGYSTIMFTAFDATYVPNTAALCMGAGDQMSTPDGYYNWTDATGPHSYPYVSQYGTIGVVNGGAGNDTGACDTAKERRYDAAHEFGHTTSLRHIPASVNTSLMNPISNSSGWPSVPIDSGQKTVLINQSLFFNGSTVTPPPPPPTCTSTTLAFGGVLGTGQTLQSPDCGIRLVMQTDGNLVVYSRLNHAIWASGSRGSNARLTLQSDYNLVVRNGAGTAIWASGTRNSGGTQLRVQNDGNVVLYSSSGAVWATHTAGDYNK